jgi:hypothetical protein
VYEGFLSSCSSCEKKREAGGKLAALGWEVV